MTAKERKVEVRKLHAHRDVVAFLMFVDTDITGADFEPLRHHVSINLPGLTRSDINVAVVGLDTQIWRTANFVGFRPIVGVRRGSRSGPEQQDSEYPGQHPVCAFHSWSSSLVCGIRLRVGFCFATACHHPEIRENLAESSLRVTSRGFLFRVRRWFGSRRLWAQRRKKLFQRKRIDYILLLEPTAAGCGDAIFHEMKVRDGVRI